MLLEFYGLECGHCMNMNPVVEKLEKELGVKLEKFETWHNEENARKQGEYDKNFCGGVPFFFNTNTGSFVCGEATYETMKTWAEGKLAPLQ